MTRHVLRRKKTPYDDYPTSSNDSRSSCLKNVRSLETRRSIVNRALNWVLLFVPLLVVFHRYLDILIWEESVWVLLSFVLVFNKSPEALLLPVIVSGACGGPEWLRMNLAMSLAYTPVGALCGFALIFPNPFPILTFSAKKFLQHLIGDSLPESETFLVSVILMNANYGASIESQPLIMLICGLAGLVPCYPMVKTIVARWRIYHCLDGSSFLITKLCYAVYFLCSGSLYYAYISPRQGVSWLVAHIETNVTLIIRWAFILAVAFLIAINWGNYLGLDGRRKLWHLTSVILFLPRSARVPFTQLALAAMIVAFIDLEVVRAAALPPLGVPIHEALRGFIDYRDVKGPVIISHIYLLLGVAVPIIAGDGNPAGVICLGLGDTFASLVGRNFGRFRFFGKKSVEGVVAFTVVTSLALHYSRGFTWMRALLVCLPSALLEAVSPLNDNLILPTYMMALMCLT